MRKAKKQMYELISFMIEKVQDVTQGYLSTECITRSRKIRKEKGTLKLRHI